MSDWPVENITNESNLFYRVHKSFIKNNELLPLVFRDIGSSMSTNWEKYITPEECHNLAKIPNDNGVIKFNVGDIRNEVKHTVTHSPSGNHRSHTDVIGLKDTEARFKYNKIYQWIIKI